MRTKITTGVEGLDHMLFGGIPEGNQILIAGGPGAGKTLLSFGCLYKNAIKGTTSLLIALEESQEQVLQNAKEAFTDFKKIDELIKKKKLVVESNRVRVFSYDTHGTSDRMSVFSKLASEITALAKKTKAKVVVVDSLSVLKSLIHDQLQYRELVFSLISSLKDMGITSIFTFETYIDDASSLASEGTTDIFLYDGIIRLRATRDARMVIPSVEITKMRGTAHSYETKPYRISKGGIEILSTGLADSNSRG